jgi:hypothetical protein
MNEMQNRIKRIIDSVPPDKRDEVKELMFEMLINKSVTNKEVEDVSHYHSRWRFVLSHIESIIDRNLLEQIAKAKSDMSQSPEPFTVIEAYLVSVKVQLFQLLEDYCRREGVDVSEEDLKIVVHFMHELNPESWGVPPCIQCLDFIVHHERTGLPLEEYIQEIKKEQRKLDNEKGNGEK